MSALVAADGVTPLRRPAAASFAASGAAHRGSDRLSQEMAGYLPSLRSPAAELHPERDALVARSRDLIRNNGYAAGIKTEMVDAVIGAYWQLACTPNWRVLGIDYEQATDWGTYVEAKWKAYADDPGCWIDAQRQRRFTGLLRAQFTTWFTTGEHLSVPVWLPERRSPGRAQYATAIRLIDPDRLGNPNGEPESRTLRGGVALDDEGAPIGYWIRDAHPGDWVMAAEASTWTYVPRETEWGRPVCLHGAIFDRPDMQRGVPPMSPVIEALRMQDVYERGEAGAAILNAMFAAVLQTPLASDPDLAAEMLGGEKTPEGFDLTLNGLRVPQLPAGVELKFINAARPVAPAFAQFEETVLRRVAAGMGISYEQVSRDYSKTNYSSARAALNQAWRFLYGLSEFTASTFADHCYALWLEEAIDRGEIELPSGTPDFYEARAAWIACQWIGPGRGLIDPTKELQAAQMGIDIGVSTLQEQAALLGKDWRDVLEQRRLEHKAMKELGLETGQGQSVYRVGTTAPAEKGGA